MAASVPALCFHRRTARWYVRLPDPSTASGYRQVYLGGDRAEAQRRYDELLERWLGSGRSLAFLDQAKLPELKAGEATVTDLCARFWDGYVLKRYVKHGRPTSERHLWGTAIRYWCEACGTVLIQAYDLTDHDRFRDLLIERGLSRGTVERYLAKAGKVVRWCAARKLAPRYLADDLAQQDPLPAHVRRTKRVLPIDRATVEATLKHAPAVVGDMARLQLCTGARPGEVCTLLVEWIDWSPEEVPEQLRGKVARADMVGHKTSHKGHERTLWFGPEALGILRRNIAPGRPHVFARAAGRPWTAARYREVLHSAARRAGVPCWSPNRLRHTHATEVRATAGADVAQGMLGHSSLTMTERYAEKDVAALVRWAAKNG